VAIFSAKPNRADRLAAIFGSTNCWLTRDALLRTSPDLLRVALPFVLISAAGLTLLLAVRKFEARRVQAELDALDRFEEETH